MTLHAIMYIPDPYKYKTHTQKKRSSVAINMIFGCKLCTTDLWWWWRGLPDGGSWAFGKPWPAGCVEKPAASGAAALLPDVPSSSLVPPLRCWSPAFPSTAPEWLLAPSRQPAADPGPAPWRVSPPLWRGSDHLNEGEGGSEKMKTEVLRWQVNYIFYLIIMSIVI